MKDRGFGMATKNSTLLRLGLSLWLAASLVPALPAQQKPDDIPDAPSATRPLPPPEPPSPRPGAPGADDDNIPLAPSSSNDSAGPSGINELPRSAPDATEAKPSPPPPVRTVPAGSAPRDAETGEDVGFTIRATTNLVLVPGMVTDSDGRLIGGL